MTEPVPEGGVVTPPAPIAGTSSSMADGQWHRLHPATPFLKGGVALIAILGFFIVQGRDEFLQALFGDDTEDPLNELLEQGLLVPVALGIVAFLLLAIGGFFLSWRMHTFRITDELVEVRSGILVRTSRRGRLDRIQGINIVRPVIARLFGAAKLEINVAGQNANVHLAYLGSASADNLRGEILRLASGTQQPSLPAAARSGDPIRDRVSELLAPELDPRLAPPQSVVSMKLGRVIGSLVLSSTTVVLVFVLIGIVVTTLVTGEPLVLVSAPWVVIGLVSYYWTKFTKSLRFTVAGTADGIRIGYGLLSTTNDTLPPGRIHSIQLSQPLLWRPAGWWEIKINRATKSAADGAGNQANTTILPVGSRDDALRVLALILPVLEAGKGRALVEGGLGPRRDDDGFVHSPRRALVLQLFAWRRNGFAMADGALLLRTGVISRQLVIVPVARMQSVALHVGWLRRRLRLATLRLHTVAGPITPVLRAVDERAAAEFFNVVAAAAALHRSRETTQRWRANE